MFLKQNILKQRMIYLEKTHLIFDSVTNAMKAKKVLNERNIKARVIKTPSVHSGRGCSYSLETDDKILAVKILGNAGITHNGEY